MLDETLQTMLRGDAALERAWAEIERLRAENNRLGAELRSALADAMQAWEQAGSDHAELNTTLMELAAAEALIEGMRRAKG